MSADSASTGSASTGSENGIRIEHTTTSGTFSLDGGTWDVDNNVWVIGNDDEVIVIDAPHDAAPILELIGDRKVVAILLSHSHNDHIGALDALKAATGAPVYLHPDDRVLWDMTRTDSPDADLSDGQSFDVAGAQVQVLHTPGHAPGACCFYVPALDAVFTGDTLFSGGPGATGRSYSDYDTIVASIKAKLLTLPPQTTVHTGHGDSTSVEAESTLE